MDMLPYTLSADTPFGVAARVVINRLYIQMIDNLPGTIDGSDIEALHDMRVASRRLRAAFRIFNRCFQKKQAAAILLQIQGVTRALGSVRDHDVFIEFLKKRSKKTKNDLSWLIDRENQLREISRESMLVALNDIADNHLYDDLLLLFANIKMKSAAHKDKFAVQAYKLIGKRLANLVNQSFAINDPELITELHMMRILAKKLRYTMEAFIPCFGQPLVDKISEVKLLQEQLGKIHDCDVWVEKLNSYLQAPDIDENMHNSIITLIDERTSHRSSVYNNALAHWTKMLDSGFAINLLEIIKYQ
jgi:CHAD domain-containing protein